MSQRKAPPSQSPAPTTGALAILAQFDRLPEGFTIAIRNGAVIVTHTTAPTTVNPQGTVSEYRVDSQQDRDIVSRGGTLWYSKYLDQVKAQPKVSK